MTTAVSTTERPAPRMGGGVLAVLAIWFAGILALHAAGAFRPADGELPILVIASILVPPLALFAAYRANAGVRAWVRGLDLADVVAIQGWRAVGALFVGLWYFGHLPAAFAFPAGLGDMAVGFAAPFVAVMAARRAAGSRAAVRGLTYAGILDFVVAVGTGIATMNAKLLLLPGEPSDVLMNALPLGIVPTFFVPMFLIAHVIALVKLRDD